MSANLPPEVAAYLAGHHVMTLATHGPEGPWAAAVFYAWTGRDLVFLSAPATRHARNLEQDNRCAATIQDDTADWKAVKGIQIEGRVERLAEEDAKRARQAYAEKFPIIGPLAKIPPAIAEALAKITWYRLLPTRMYFIDNSKGFGHRGEFLPD
ncbi:MAG: pyridoxamine 5'-phosphate oxidase family protein [Sulfuritalea sp.]|nr:pyridoxamine 5'-phosphate oxidase family protein [Sulfuritalea sp.]